MFPIASEVTILTSSMKKGTGARRGSIGHVVATGNPAFLNETGVISQQTLVLFNRFGFEKSKRIEKKWVINVFPFIQLNKNVEKGFDNERVVSETIKFLRNENYNHDNWTNIRNMYDVDKSVPICFLSTIPHRVKDLSKNPITFGRWMTAHMLNQGFRHQISAMKQSSVKKRLNEPFDYDIIDNIYKMTRSKDTRVDYIRELKKSDKLNRRKQYIETLNKIKAMQTRIDIYDHLDRYKHESDIYRPSNEGIVWSLFFENLCSCMFDSNILNRKIEILKMNEKDFNREVVSRNIIKHMKEVMHYIRAEAHKTIKK